MIDSITIEWEHIWSKNEKGMNGALEWRRRVKFENSPIWKFPEPCKCREEKVWNISCVIIWDTKQKAFAKIAISNVWTGMRETEEEQNNRSYSTQLNNVPLSLFPRSHHVLSVFEINAIFTLLVCCEKKKVLTNFYLIIF